jgi:hypothetical protein
MTDQELDELLNRWEAPETGEAARERLRAGYAGLPALEPVAAPKRRLRRVATIAVGIAALLFAIIQISPETVRMASPGYRIPFYVEYQFWRYADDGRTAHPSRVTAFPYAGHEIIMSVREPGHFLMVAARNIANSIRDQFILAMPSLVLPKGPPMAEPAWFADFVNSGCAKDKLVVGHEKVAGYSTTVVESGAPNYRVKVWMAPELQCFALKFTSEVPGPGGTYRPLFRKEAVKVTMNP